MSTHLKYAVVLVVGISIGAIGAVAFRPGQGSLAPTPSPLVDTRGGHVAGTDPPGELRPLTLRVGDDLTRLGNPSVERPRVATVYLDVSGVPVVASYEVVPPATP